MDRRSFLGAIGAVACARAFVDGPLAAADEAQTTARKKYRVIDTHVHLFNTHVMGTEGVAKITYLGPDASIEGFVAAAKAGGVDRGFLITYNAQDIARQLVSYKVDPALARLVYNTKYQKSVWKKHPELFWWFPDHVDPTRETYLEDLERDFEEGGAGVKLLPVFHGYLPDHPGFIPVYELCRRYRKPIILDLSFWYMVGSGGAAPPLLPAFELESRQKLVKRFSDYARLISPIFRQFSDVPFSLAHTGTAHRESDYDEIFPVIAEHPNVSCDIAASTGYSAAFLQRLVKAVGAHKVMYGTDWPYWASGAQSYLKGERRWTIITDECPALDEQQKRMILAGNADRFVQYQMPKVLAAAEKS